MTGHLWAATTRPFFCGCAGGTPDQEDQECRLEAHLRTADGVQEVILGPLAGDLVDVLTAMAVAGPGCARSVRYRGSTGGVDAPMHNSAAVGTDYDDPWTAIFAAALAAPGDGDSDIKPYWILTRPGGAVTER